MFYFFTLHAYYFNSLPSDPSVNSAQEDVMIALPYCEGSLGRLLILDAHSDGTTAGALLLE